MDGRTLREHLEGAYRQTGRLPELLANAPCLPAGTETLWSDFAAMHGARGSTGFGVARIGYGEIDAYQRVHDFRFEPWQVDALIRADTAFIVIHAEGQKAKAH